MPCFLVPLAETIKALPDSPSKTMDTPRLRLVPNLRLVFRDEQQESGKGEHQPRSTKRQWINAIDTSLAKTETFMQDNRSRVANQRKPSASKRWRPIQSPSETITTRKKRHSRLLEAEILEHANHKAIAPGPIYQPLHFVSPGDVSETPLHLSHGKRRSTDQHSKTLSRSRATRPTVTLSSSRPRSNHQFTGFQREHKQTVSSPLAFRTATLSECQRDSRDIGHLPDSLSAVECGKQAPVETKDVSRGVAIRTSMMTSGFMQLYPQSVNKSTICAIQQTDVDGTAGEVAIEAPASQLGTHTLRSRAPNYSVNAEPAKNSGLTSFPGRVATLEGIMPKTHSTPLGPKQPLSILCANSKSTLPRKPNAIFRPLSAVLDHPEILLGLLEKTGERRKQDRYERQHHDASTHISFRNRSCQRELHSPHPPSKKGKSRTSRRYSPILNHRGLCSVRQDSEIE